MELRRNGLTVTNDDSLLLTCYKTTDPFSAEADQIYRKKKAEERKLLIEELDRRNLEGAYDV